MTTKSIPDAGKIHRLGESIINGFEEVFGEVPGFFFTFHRPGKNNFEFIGNLHTEDLKAILADTLAAINESAMNIKGHVDHEGNVIEHH